MSIHTELHDILHVPSLTWYQHLSVFSGSVEIICLPAGQKVGAVHMSCLVTVSTCCQIRSSYITFLSHGSYPDAYHCSALTCRIVLWKSTFDNFFLMHRKTVCDPQLWPGSLTGSFCFRHYVVLCSCLHKDVCATLQVCSCIWTMYQGTEQNGSHGTKTAFARNIRKWASAPKKLCYNNNSFIANMYESLLFNFKNCKLARMFYYPYNLLLTLPLQPRTVTASV